jgi:Fe-S-cluster containining protein
MSGQHCPDTRVDSVVERQRAVTIDTLRASRQDAAAAALAQQVQDDLTAAIEALPSKAKHACAPGCDFCCYLPVDVLAPEAFRIAAHLQRTRSPADLATLVYHLGAQGQYGLGLRPCVFLADHQCSIYEVRPLVCRGYNSLSRERCEAYHHDPQADLRGTKDRVAGRLAEAMEDGVIAGIEALGLDAQWYELSGAVLRALETTDGPRRWARGETVFEGCDRLSGWDC